MLPTISDMFYYIYSLTDNVIITYKYIYIYT